MPPPLPAEQSLGTIAAAAGVQETAITLPALSTAFLDSAAVPVLGAKKVIYLAVASALTWVTSGQATWRPFVGRQGFVAVGGAATGLDVQHLFLAAATNLGAAAQTSLPAGLYRLSPSTTNLGDLAYPDPYLGVELQFPSALTGGAAALYVEAST